MPASVLFSLILCGVVYATEPWSHIEYGAANTQSGSVVLARSKAPDLSVLFDRVKALTARHPGERGIVYVNDLDAETTHRAANLLYIYCQQNEYPIEVVSWPGDYHQIDLPTTDTAALANPEGDFFDFANRPDEVLQRLANHTSEGLELTTSVPAAANIVFALGTGAEKGRGRFYTNPLGKVVPKPTTHFIIRRNTPLPLGAHGLGFKCPVELRGLVNRN